MSESVHTPGPPKPGPDIIGLILISDGAAWSALSAGS